MYIVKYMHERRKSQPLHNNYEEYEQHSAGKQTKEYESQGKLQAELHIWYIILEYIYLKEITLLGKWSIVMAILWTTLHTFLKICRQSSYNNNKSRLFGGWLNVPLSDLLFYAMFISNIVAFPCIVYWSVYQGSQYSLLLLLPSPLIYHCFLPLVTLIFHKIILLMINILILISLSFFCTDTHAVILITILFLYIFQIYNWIIIDRNLFLFRDKNLVLKKQITVLEEALLEKENETIALKNKENSILNQIPYSIILFNKITGLVYMNYTFRDFLSEHKCKDFEDFINRCMTPNTDINLSHDIRAKIEYFSSNSATLHRIKEIKVDFELRRGINDLPNFTYKELEVTYCKGDNANDILLFINMSESEKSKKEKKIVERYKNVISKSICHDLKTPLNGIIGPLENFPAEFKSDISYKIIKSSAIFLQYKIDDMIDYSEIELNEFIPHNKVINPSSLLRRLKHLCENQCELSNLQLKLEIGRSLPQVFNADGQRITQIMLHLIQNAIKYTKSGLIVIYCKRSNEVRNSLEFGVKDSGIGMSEEVKMNLSHLLNTGLRANLDQSTNSSLIEMGFGLWLTEKICKNIDSRLVFVSNKGSGSTFHFSVASKLMAKSFCTGKDKRRRSRRNSTSKFRLDNPPKRKTMTSSMDNLKVEEAVRIASIDKSNEEEEDWHSLSFHSSSLNGEEIQSPVAERDEKEEEDYEEVYEEESKGTISVDQAAESDSNLQHQVTQKISIYHSIRNRERPSVDFGLDSLDSLPLVKYKTEGPQDMVFSSMLSRNKGTRSLEKIESVLEGDLSPDEGIEYEEMVQSPFKALSKYSREMNSMTKVQAIPLRLQTETHVKSKSTDFRIVKTGLASHSFAVQEYSSLVVDDSPLNRLVIKGILIRSGIKVGEAENGSIAIEMCKKRIKENELRKPYDIIFMDLDMPVMNGLSATKELVLLFRLYNWAIPIIAVTAYSSDKVKTECCEAGMVKVCEKPINCEVIKYLLQKYLGIDPPSHKR